MRCAAYGHDCAQSNAHAILEELLWQLMVHLEKAIKELWGVRLLLLSGEEGGRDPAASESLLKMHHQLSNTSVSCQRGAQGVQR